jgi:hypothetical protein
VVIEQGLSKSLSVGTYASMRGGDDYSLEQYSHDASDTSSRYSESSRTTYTDGSEPPGNHHHHPQQHKQWRQNDYGRNLQHVNESNSYESAHGKNLFT